MSHKDLSRKVKDLVVPVQTIVRPFQTIAEALSSLRRKRIDNKIIYFYVVDEEDCLIGVVPTRTLLLKDPEERISDVMEKNVVCLKEDQNLEQAMQALSSHHLLALPVVDEKHRFCGVIDVQLYLEENIDIARSQRSMDIFQFLGISLEEGLIRHPLKGYAKRMPWIFCNMIGGIGCAIISHFFKVVLSEVIILAMFIPLVLSLSESISMQSMTQSLQLLRKQKQSWRRIFVRVFSEVKIVALMSATSGVIVGVLSLLWDSGVGASCVIAVGLTTSILLSASMGSLIPLFLHARQLDPKVASGPIVLTLADVVTTTIYLSLASLWLL